MSRTSVSPAILDTPVDGSSTLHVHSMPTLTDEWSIEFLRGVAALMVVFAHYQVFLGVNVGLFAFAFSGVHLFFVLSGFVFAPYLYGKTIAFRSFALRRIFRIYPLYLIALGIYVALHWFSGQPIRYLWQHLLFLHTFQSREAAFYFNPAFWSLPPELEFYMCVPLLALVVKTTKHYLILFSVALFIHAIVSWHQTTDPTAVNGWVISAVHLPGLLIEFVLGGLVWLFAYQLKDRRVRICLLFLGMVLWVWLARRFTTQYAVGGDVSIQQDVFLRGDLGLIAAIAFTLMIVGVVGAINQPPSWLKNTASWFGKLSYGTYLFHNAAPLIWYLYLPSLSGVKLFTLSLVLTLCLAYGLHLLVEAPARAFGRRLAGCIYQFNS